MDTTIPLWVIVNTVTHTFPFHPNRSKQAATLQSLGPLRCRFILTLEGSGRFPFDCEKRFDWWTGFSALLIKVESIDRHRYRPISWGVGGEAIIVIFSILQVFEQSKQMSNQATACNKAGSNKAGSNKVYPWTRRAMLRELEAAGLPLTEGSELSALNKNLCVWLPRFTGNTFPGINVFGLAVPHAGCLEDSDKWPDNKNPEWWETDTSQLLRPRQPTGTRCLRVVCLCARSLRLSSPAADSSADGMSSFDPRRICPCKVGSKHPPGPA